MKAREAQGPRVHVRKSCVTKEKLAREPFQEKDQKTCTHTVISRTGSHWQSKISCAKPKRDGDFNIEAVSREHIKGGMQMKASGHNHEVSIHVSIDGKWLASDCGNIH